MKFASLGQVSLFLMDQNIGRDLHNQLQAIDSCDLELSNEIPKNGNGPFHLYCMTMSL